MGFIATLLRLPYNLRRKSSYLKKTIIESTEKEEKIFEFFDNQEKIINSSRILNK
jgi:hypothetical protein